ncbi:MAG: hypothetical protein IJ008_03390 [Clostridia bacterium]|nr:hypothetical protein [Clostridia bacterium]
MEEISLRDKIASAKFLLKHTRYNQFRFCKNENAILRLGNDYLHPMCFSFYTSTNENLYYYARISFKGKDVLVPTASGDHAFNAIYYGAKSVETFDINAFAALQYNLKETAIKYLSREEFIEFYTVENFFNFRTYFKLRPFLNDDTRVFFDEIYTFISRHAESKDPLFPLIEEYFMQDESIIQRNPYLKNEASFADMKRKLLKLKTPVKHRLCPLHELDVFFDEKDIVILSNILSYYYSNTYKSDDYLDRFEESLSTIERVMKPTGIASVLYLYNYHKVADSKMRKIIVDRVSKKNVSDIDIVNRFCEEDDIHADRVVIVKKPDTIIIK